MDNLDPNSSLQVEKLRNRKSRAVWQNNNTSTHNNPYANLSTGEKSRSRHNTGSSYVSPYGGGNGEENAYTGNNNKSNTSGNLLQVPGAGGGGGDLNSNKKQSRRMSIHVSARQHGRSFSQTGPIDMANLPALPKIGGVTTSGVGGAGGDVMTRTGGLTIEQKIFKELSQGSAAEVDDYYKTLLKQKNLITRDIKDNINQNQKNILQLTKDLKETQEELIELRGTTKELYEVLGYFKESAQRRLELEFEPETQKELHLPQKSNQLGIPSNKKKDRSSIMVLKKMWDSQLQSLFKHVDGASKFVQPLPNRHIVAESGRWFEVNVGNWKPSYPTHLFIFNDLILIAVKKSSSSSQEPTTGGSNGGSKSRLQAVQCWPLTQVSLQQIKSPKKDDDKMYFINLKSKSLSYVYLTDRYDHFVKVTEAFNKGRNEMIQSERLLDSRLSSPSNNNGDSKEEKRQLRESLRNSGNYKEGVTDDAGGAATGGGRKSAGTPNRNSTDYVLHDISARVHSRNRSQDLGNNFKLANNGKSQFFNEIKTLEDRLDDVDVEISHNQYAEAVELISIIESKLRNIENALTNQRNGGKNVNIADELLLLDVSKLKIKNRKENVSNGLIFDLQHNIAKLKQDDIDNILTLFDNLEQLDRGVQGYLDSMSAYLSTTVSKLIVGLQGSTKIDVVNYLSNLMVINVSIVKRTIQTYEQIIAPILKRHGDVDSSGLINWCIDEFTKLCKQIKKHLYGTLLISSGINMETDEPIYKVKERKLYDNFLKIMQPQLEELKLVGLNVDYIFESILNLE